MSASPLVDACVINHTNIPYVNAEAARGIEIQLREEIARLRAFIDDLDEIGRHSGKTENREWHGCAGWLYKGHVVYIGEEKP